MDQSKGGGEETLGKNYGAKKGLDIWLHSAQDPAQQVQGYANL